MVGSWEGVRVRREGVFKSSLESLCVWLLSSAHGVLCHLFGPFSETKEDSYRLKIPQIAYTELARFMRILGPFMSVIFFLTFDKH